jgi:hypothetical protein
MLLINISKTDKKISQHNINLFSHLFHLVYKTPKGVKKLTISGPNSHHKI